MSGGLEVLPEGEDLQTIARAADSPLLHQLPRWTQVVTLRLPLISNKCKFSTREIQRDLGDMHRKVNLLIEWTLGTSSQPQPEFNDPFASSSTQTFGPRLSGLNTLTSSLGQLLALQMLQVHSTSNITGPPLMSPGNATLEVNPTLTSLPALLGHGLPNRPDMRPSPRLPNPPMRTWSTGALDVPI
ncbi:hypothetical protein EV361DRAFT_984463 [Lentinula raphanica]|nr:hypothetical protein EV361DRAFT_984463 [Lentinula raphanica]